MSTLAITPASGAITAARTVTRVNISAAPASTPAGAEIRYYLAFELAGVEQGRSYVFGVNGGKHEFNNYIFPSAGSWNVRLRKASDNSIDTTLAVTVA